MPQTLTRPKAGMPSACPWKTASWIHNRLTIGLVMLATATTTRTLGLEVIR